MTEALAAELNQEVADIFRMLLLSGARSGEVTKARWGEFDFGRGTWTKPATNTKTGVVHEIPLNAAALELLARRLAKRGTSDLVFPGRGDKPRNGVQYVWRRVCKAAGLADFHIHDLRHSYASTLVGAGFSLPMVGALLGHKLPTTTARYAHLANDPLREATERAGAILSGQPVGEVVPMRGRR